MLIILLHDSAHVEHGVWGRPAAPVSDFRLIWFDPV